MGPDINSQVLQSNPGMLDFATYSNDSITGLEYANQRWYTAGYGRFLTADPYAGSATTKDPSFWNRYSYLSGDPVNGTDRRGRFLDAEDCIQDPDACGAEDSTWGGAGVPVSVTDDVCPSVRNGFEPNPEATAEAGCDGTPPPPPPDTCGQYYTVATQAEGVELAVLFGEDSWTLPTYSHDAVAQEDLYMLEAMYNQASTYSKFVPTPAYVASTVNNGTYRGYGTGRTRLTSAINSDVGSSTCDHLISTEQTFGDFWSGDLTFSSFNTWRSVISHGPPGPGQAQFAGTVFWYSPGTVALPHRGRHYPPIRLLPRPRRKHS